MTRSQQAKKVFEAMGGLPIRWGFKVEHFNGNRSYVRRFICYAGTEMEARAKAEQHATGTLLDEPVKKMPMLWSDGKLVAKELFLLADDAVAYTATFADDKDVKARTFKGSSISGNLTSSERLWYWSVIVRSRYQLT